MPYILVEENGLYKVAKKMINQKHLVKKECLKREQKSR